MESKARNKTRSSTGNKLSRARLQGKIVVQKKRQTRTQTAIGKNGLHVRTMHISYKTIEKKDAIAETRVSASNRTKAHVSFLLH